ncbi:MAG: HNH endonuclease [Solirubrobacteraceae bacterium]|nr:HNH endonuclease [Solirubrobacteraceae bacterium]
MKACKVCGRIGERDRCDEHELGERPRGRSFDRLRLRIAERDHWTCYLCREHIDRRLRHPHPRALHIGHVVSRTAGGSDDESNLAASHAECNLAMGGG